MVEALVDAPNDTRLRARLVTVLVMLAALLPGATRLAAQSGQYDDVVIASLDQFPDLDARSIIVREAGREFVLLRADSLSVAGLAMTLRVLDRVRLQPVDPGHGQIIPITGFVLTQPPRGPLRRDLERNLNRLRAAPTTTIGRYGMGRWVRFNSVASPRPARDRGVR